MNDFKRINVFFGKNNCGKSSVLEALFLITGPSNPILPLSLNSMRNYTNFSENDLNIDFYNLNPENVISISVQGNENRWLEISQITPQSETINLDNALAEGITDNVGKTYGFKLNFSIGCEDDNYTSELIVREGEKGESKIIQDDRYKEKLFSKYLTSTSQSPLYEEFAKIVANKQESHILTVLRDIDPAIKDIQLVGKEILVDIGAEQRLPINMCGDGLRKLLMIIVSVYRCKDGVLLIDEIDNGFHFSAMEVLWKAILKAKRENNVQLFASTHNIDSLRGLNKVLNDKDYTEDRNNVCAYKLIKKDRGQVIGLRYDYQSFNYSINQELEMR